MNIDEIGAGDPDALAPVVLAALQRLGELGRAGAIALAKLVTDDHADFHEAASWIAEIAAGPFND
ncbi:hypothetical protein [Sphingobium sp.]|uniref:hypothetical protein n=1 Tax=Sphingobium sp. TaxID=1912891 RepID=UPI002C7A7DEB|nr:hypothetical protein [Sphingobium sp.]HUD91752.1 hypothetical protein [Sphingobium sp.]